MKGITPDDAVFIAQWSLRSDQERIQDELERRKNLALTKHRINVSIDDYKKTTNWKAVEVKKPTGSIEDPYGIFSQKDE